jgi:hypothetical protein
VKKLNDNFGFVDISELELNPDRNKSSNIGKDIYILCPDTDSFCSGHGYLALATKFGQCYTCGVTYKLHKQYHSWSEERLISTLFADNGVSQGRLDTLDTAKPSHPTPVVQPPPDPPQLTTTRLSDKAKEYIYSRGLTEKTRLQFYWLAETHLWGSEWLCWSNESGGYELREIGGFNRRAMPLGSTKDISLKRVGNPGGYQGPRTLVITEGLFSAMSHHQLREGKFGDYIILNSVTMVSRVANHDWSKFGQVRLALDLDEAGQKGKVQLAKFFLMNYPQINIEVDHPPIWGDWNEYLLAQQKR